MQIHKGSIASHFDNRGRHISSQRQICRYRKFRKTELESSLLSKSRDVIVIGLCGRQALPSCQRVQGMIVATGLTTSRIA